MSCSFTVQVPAQLDLFRNLTRTKAYKNDFQLLPKELDAKVAKIALFSTRCGAIGDGRSPRLRRTVAHRAPPVRDDSGRSPRSRRTVGRRAPRVRDDSEEPSITKNCCTSSLKYGFSKWKSRAQVAESCLKVRRVDCVTNAPVPQGTTALSTPPFVRAGYDCRNNTTVLKRPEAAGWAPLVCAGPLTTSLRGLWVSGLLPPGNGGTNEGAATQKPTERHKGAATQKPTSERRNSRSNLGARGGDPRTLASWRH